jgi:hypothetical protein
MLILLLLAIVSLDALADHPALVAGVEPFHRYISSESSLPARDCETVVAMRERTPFRASTFERLPRLPLLVTTGVAILRRTGAAALHGARAVEPVAASEAAVAGHRGCRRSGVRSVRADLSVARELPAAAGAQSRHGHKKIHTCGFHFHSLTVPLSATTLSPSNAALL